MHVPCQNDENKDASRDRRSLVKWMELVLQGSLGWGEYLRDRKSLQMMYRRLQTLQNGGFE